MWLYFCMVAIGLLSREEGELAPVTLDEIGDSGIWLKYPLKISALRSPFNVNLSPIGTDGLGACI